MYKKNVLKKHVNVTSFNFLVALCLVTSAANAQSGAPVPGYVPPLTVAQAPNYADDTRGVFVPSHTQHRMKTDAEVQNYQKVGGDSYSNGLPTGSTLLAQAYSSEDSFERELNRISNGHVGNESNLNRIAAGNGANQNAYSNQGYEMQTAPSGIQNGQMSAPQVVRTGEGVEIAQGAVQNRTLDMTNSLVRLREDQVSIRRALQRMMDQMGYG